MEEQYIKRLINCVFTDTACNLNCRYCYVGQLDEHVKTSTKNTHDIEEIRRALSCGRLGGRCHMNMCATGETLLVDNIVELAEAFLDENHIVTIVTNGLITKRIEEICQFPTDYKNRLFFKISFHYLELKQKKLLSRFWENVKMIQHSGISFTIELTVNDESIPYIDEIKKECMKHVGANCHVIESRVQDKSKWPRFTALNTEEHQKIWHGFNSELFDFQQTIWGEKRTEFCYAGDWITSINLKSGDVHPCFGGGRLLDNIYRDIEAPISFQAIGNHCPWGHCYAAYVLLTHGAIPGFSAPTYASERNRITASGTEWLTPCIKEMFSHRLVEENPEYTYGRKLITNFIMGLIYDSYSPNEENEVSAMLEDYFQRNNYTKAAIYGAGKIGRKLYELLKKSGILVCCFIDREAERIKSDIPCQTLDSGIGNVDIIINTIYYEDREIKKQLSELHNIDVISVLDLYC